MQTVAILGTGLIGASFGLALKKAGFTGRILGVSSPAALEAALARGAIDEGAGLEPAVAAADLVYLAQPIRRILEILPKLDALARPGALITDAGSTKAAIVAAAGETIRRCQFLGGHPLAGKERRGASEADAELFRGRTYVLTPAGAGDLQTPAARRFLELLRSIGALPVTLEPAEHDRIVAFTSHLPQLASTGLAAVVAENLPASEQVAIAGPGLEGMTRLASSSYEIWRDILATNAPAVIQAISAYIDRLEFMRRNLGSPELGRMFERAASLAAGVRGRSAGNES
ncbi:MAG: prephenate dehydrogenase/arogenate dehydrogenase family protein [Acidobacteria bacterium]|nr:prephenate dehydrogenase/arogenate dehydrogenase family protein [Acidobacteriota bacterium]